MSTSGLHVVPPSTTSGSCRLRPFVEVTPGVDVLPFSIITLAPVVGALMLHPRVRSQSTCSDHLFFSVHRTCARSSSSGTIEIVDTVSMGLRHLRSRRKARKPR